MHVAAGNTLPVERDPDVYGFAVGCELSGEERGVIGDASG
jgi:hypothetical protein